MSWFGSKLSLYFFFIISGKGVGFQIRDPVPKRTEITELKLTQKIKGIGKVKVKVKRIQHHSILLNTTLFCFPTLKEAVKQI